MSCIFKESNTFWRTVSVRLQPNYWLVNSDTRTLLEGQGKVQWQDCGGKPHALPLLPVYGTATLPANSSPATDLWSRNLSWKGPNTKTVFYFTSLVYLLALPACQLPRRAGVLNVSMQWNKLFRFCSVFSIPNQTQYDSHASADFDLTLHESR